MLGRPARGRPHGRLVPHGSGPVCGARYLDVVALPRGGHRLYYEAPRPDGSHELRTGLVPPVGGTSPGRA